MAAKKKPARPKAKRAEKPPSKPLQAQGEESPRPRGRPPEFTPELQEAFCELIADGRTCRGALEELGNVVGWTTVKRWLRDDEDFRSHYARAREEQADHDADEIRDLQRRVLGVLRDGETSVGHQEARLAIDTLKWLASKRAPKKYGSDLELGDDDKQMLVVVRKFAGQRDSEKRGQK